MLSRTPYEAIPNTEAAHVSTLATATATRLSALAGVTIHANTGAVVMQAEGTVRFTTTTATAPTAAIGYKLDAGDIVELSRAEFEACRVIRTGGTDVALQIAQLK